MAMLSYIVVCTSIMNVTYMFVCYGRVCMLWSCLYAMVVFVCYGHVCMPWSCLYAIAMFVCAGRQCYSNDQALSH